MNISLCLVFLVGVGLSNSLATDKKSNSDIDVELDELKRLLLERIQEKNTEDEDRPYISEERRDETEIAEEEKGEEMEPDKKGNVMSSTQTSPLRLVGGRTRYEGRLEVFHSGQWGTICDDGANYHIAQVACRQIFGISSKMVATKTQSFFGAGSGQIWIDDLVCTGNETSIDNCQFQPWGTNSCGHHEDLSVICRTLAYPIRLVNPSGGSPNSGRIEIQVNNTWGTVCDYGFNANAAGVVCAMAGFSRFLFGNCHHNEDVGVQCQIGLLVVAIPQSSYAAVLGTNHVTITCLVSGSPANYVFWTKIQGGQSTNINIGSSNGKYQGGSVNNSSLTILNIAQSDEAYYVCSASNVVGTSSSQQTFFDVTGTLPIVTIAQPAYSVNSGSSVTLGCTISFDLPITQVFWQRNINGFITTINITTNTNKYSGSTTNTPSLTIYNADQGDIGTYSCFASNSVGTGQSGSTTLSVIETCTFEKGTSCFMVDSSEDDFDWTVKSGGTPSYGTGPSEAFEGDQYTYIEVSDPISNNDEATLVSSGSLPAPDYCLVFAYHMEGASNMGDLVILTGVQSPTKEWLRIPGSQGNQWHEKTVEFTGGQNVKLFITANRGQTYTGDIAIDNVRLYPDVCRHALGACIGVVCQNGGSCLKNATSTSGYMCICPPGFAGFHCKLIDVSMKTNLFCGFEDKNDNCVFKESIHADFKWIINKKDTNTSGTGPNQAYEGTYYTYMEASSPSVNGDQAILSTESSQLASLTLYCLEFYYHMMGSPGSLSVSVGERNGSNFTLWTISGNQGNQWKLQQLQISPSFKDLEISIIGTRGWSYTGDIAVDSISLKKEACQTISPCDSSPCSNSGTCIDTNSGSFKCVCSSEWMGNTCDTVVEYKCNFEKGETCIFTDSKADDFDWTRNTGPTKTSGTGPKGAYSGMYYLYTEVSYPVMNGEIALLTSENTKLTGSNYCLSLAYQRLGNPGPLIVRTGERGDGKPKVVWAMSGNQGINWKTISIVIPFYSDPVITIQGGKADTYKGDTAIDDVILKIGPCN